MSKGTDKLIKQVQEFADNQYQYICRKYGQDLIDIFDFPIKLVLSPFTIAWTVVGSAPRGFGVPKFISKVSYTAIFVSSFFFVIAVILLFCSLFNAKWDLKL